MEEHEKFKKFVGRLVRYLANLLLVITILVFITGLFTKGSSLYSDQLLWTQINTMWIVVIMLILVENFYLKPEHRMGYEEDEKESKSSKKKK